MMVRNAFARADNFHERATAAGSSSTTVPDGSPMHPEMAGIGVHDGVQNTNLHGEVRGTDAASGGSNPAESGDSHSQAALRHGECNGNGHCSREEGVFGRAENEDPGDDSSESSSFDEWEASDDIANDGGDVEELM